MLVLKLSKLPICHKACNTVSSFRSSEVETRSRWSLSSGAGGDGVSGGGGGGGGGGGSGAGGDNIVGGGPSNFGPPNITPVGGVPNLKVKYASLQISFFLCQN